MRRRIGRQGCNCLVYRDDTGVALDLQCLALIWTFICMGFWNGLAELLIGKRALWLVALNQSQRADVNMEMVRTMGNKMETGAVRSLICRSVIDILTRTSTLIFFVHSRQIQGAKVFGMGYMDGEGKRVHVFRL
ncbi:hypothetical protein F2Q69_00029901 [Brassica cretica]|uniref:Uncharacterized protein n=1 Tax=Brassica cretica TaxID=69181 RepID=A0A8S9S665_BRACR|nr:hypothetical protein F2Q69_00029901 [Brassica cretica]